MSHSSSSWIFILAAPVSRLETATILIADSVYNNLYSLSQKFNLLRVSVSRIASPRKSLWNLWNVNYSELEFLTSANSHTSWNRLQRDLDRIKSEYEFWRHKQQRKRKKLKQFLMTMLLCREAVLRQMEMTKHRRKTDWSSSTQVPIDRSSVLHGWDAPAKNWLSCAICQSF